MRVSVIDGNLLYKKSHLLTNTIERDENKFKPRVAAIRADDAILHSEFQNESKRQILETGDLKVAR